ncbi:hypothetical protein [Deinococcus soli (ex Cha et al. 2016)]|uniref:Repeat protein (TIGR01451 family) n=2 Tax=Deinococcus soli (ex Cha et al. 2016) TaxID=1309411 RepID=A0ACC6KGT4_9DEIO|nr:hypothetical protein [Deinococcus soli (ex Cha et al. 2016)]MDR6218971.1 putative repeat protein (TIGR01451 family) [Deinococcus soli (ex Cha et al. 2016)]MDR6328768.1 putative repeat protein (TIGR01451 family) [Deinococcus soli (ex Cha et al. 2016)]MDR6751745.1 putative repeat protein (TIGR01451 family) [Deinococcus soli (ex Cha et al. 2016)]
MRALLTLAALSSAALASTSSVDFHLDRITVIQQSGLPTEVRERNPKQVHPGDLLEQVATARNASSSPLRDVRVTVPVPKGTTFHSGDLTGSVISADGGKTFAAAPLKETVTEGGQTVTRVIPPNRYTHVRYLIPLIPAKSFATRAYRVTVK